MCDKNNFFLKQSLKETRSYAPSFNLRRANQRRANLRRASGDPYILIYLHGTRKWAIERNARLLFVTRKSVLYNQVYNQGLFVE